MVKSDCSTYSKRSTKGSSRTNDSREIRLKGEKKILYKHKMEKFSVAPNSNFDFNIPIGLNTFKPGTYHFTGKATGDGRTWKWEKEFKVGEAQAKK